MEDIIEKVFELEFRTNGFSFETKDKELIENEWTLYEKLLEVLDDQEKEIYLKYIRLREKREREEIKSAYKNGFITAIKLWEECKRK